MVHPGSGRGTRRGVYLKIPITLSSDAHQPEELDGYYKETMDLLKDIGFKELACISSEGWKRQGI